MWSWAKIHCHWLIASMRSRGLPLIAAFFFLAQPKIAIWRELVGSNHGGGAWVIKCDFLFHPLVDGFRFDHGS